MFLEEKVVDRKWHYKKIKLHLSYKIKNWLIFVAHDYCLTYEAK